MRKERDGVIMLYEGWYRGGLGITQTERKNVMANRHVASCLTDQAGDRVASDGMLRALWGDSWINGGIRYYWGRTIARATIRRMPQPGKDVQFYYARCYTADEATHGDRIMAAMTAWRWEGEDSAADTGVHRCYEAGRWANVAMPPASNSVTFTTVCVNESSPDESRITSSVTSQHGLTIYSTAYDVRHANQCSWWRLREGETNSHRDNEGDIATRMVATEMVAGIIYVIVVVGDARRRGERAANGVTRELRARRLTVS